MDNPVLQLAEAVYTCRNHLAFVAGVLDRKEPFAFWDSNSNEQNAFASWGDEAGERLADLELRLDAAEKWLKPRRPGFLNIAKAEDCREMGLGCAHDAPLRAARELLFGGRLMVGRLAGIDHKDNVGRHFYTRFEPEPAVRGPIKRAFGNHAAELSLCFDDLCAGFELARVCGAIEREAARPGALKARKPRRPGRPRSSGNNPKRDELARQLIDVDELGYERLGERADFAGLSRKQLYGCVERGRAAHRSANKAR